MKAVHAILNGTTVKALPSQPLLPIEGDAQVIILYLEEPASNGQVEATTTDQTSFVPRPRKEWEAAQRLLALRDAMEPLDVSLRDLIEEGRER